MVKLSFGQTTSANSGVFVSNERAESFTQDLVNGAFVFEPPRKIIGSYHVFDTWDNKGVIKTKDDKMFKIKSININVRNNSFETKFAKDSVFAFNGDDVKYFIINDKKYKNLYVSIEKKKKICEIIVEDETFKVLKGYRGVVREKATTGYDVGPDGDQYIIRKFYYLIKDENAELFKFNKKSVLGLFSDKKKEIEKFVKENKLSWKKPEDFQQMYLKWKIL